MGRSKPGRDAESRRTISFILPNLVVERGGDLRIPKEGLGITERTSRSSIAIWKKIELGTSSNSE